jgi:hypothetical protein
MVNSAADRDAQRSGAARLPPYLRAGSAGPAQRPPAPHRPRHDDEIPVGLRPFVLTAGRVDGGDQDINVETQVTSNLDPDAAPSVAAGLPSELRAIITLCGVPISIAEISARLRLHLGVTKILVGDLRAAGHLEIHRVDLSDHHSPETIMRVIRGLRALT